MTDEELSAIEALANAATPLVWQADKPMEDGYPCPMCDGEGDLTFTITEAGGTCAAGVQVFGIGKDLEAMRKFHELALTNTQALIAEVRRLKAEEKRLQETITKLERRLELAENVCRLICAAGIHKQHMDNLLDAMNAWIKERDE